MAWMDAEFCESRCPVCTRARRGNRLAKLLQKLEMALTGGGCPAGRARQRNTACARMNRYRATARSAARGVRS